MKLNKHRQLFTKTKTKTQNSPGSEPLTTLGHDTRCRQNSIVQLIDNVLVGYLLGPTCT